MPVATRTCQHATSRRSTTSTTRRQAGPDRLGRPGINKAARRRLGRGSLAAPAASVTLLLFILPAVIAASSSKNAAAAFAPPPGDPCRRSGGMATAATGAMGGPRPSFRITGRSLSPFAINRRRIHARLVPSDARAGTHFFGAAESYHRRGNAAYYIDRRNGRAAAFPAAASSSSALLFSSSFRDDDSEAKYDALKDALRGGSVGAGSTANEGVGDGEGAEYGVAASTAATEDKAGGGERPPQPREMVDGLLGMAVGRALRAYSTTTTAGAENASGGARACDDDSAAAAGGGGRSAAAFGRPDAAAAAAADLDGLVGAAVSRAGLILEERSSGRGEATYATPSNGGAADDKGGIGGSKMNAENERPPPVKTAKTKTEKKKEKAHVDKRTYLSNPCVTPTALAHALWRSTVLPNVDTVIDATCGNGKDAAALAEMLFPDNGEGAAAGVRLDDGDGNDGSDNDIVTPELLCIDIQQRACENTQRALRSILDAVTYDQCVRVVPTSHAPLPEPRDGRSVGLVCYNLGYLPGGTTTEKGAFATQLVTTLFSLADAALMLRVGGLLSVMTYPGTNLDEANAVRYFCEGLAMLTTRDAGGWEGYVDSIPPDDEGRGGGEDGVSGEDGSGGSSGDGFLVRDLVRSLLERVVGEGDREQTWRVFDHRPLGRPLSPILVTAIRIK